MREQLPQAFSKKRILAGAILSLTLITGCNGTKQNTSADDRIEATAPSAEAGLQDHADQLWSDALTEFWDKVAAHKKIGLLVAKGVCLYWPASIQGIDTVVRNPVLYRYQKGSEELDFLPFVPSVPKSEQLEIMNGPFTYSDSSKGINNYGNLGAVVFADGFEIFTPSKGAFALQQEINPSPFTAAWLEADNGTRVDETQLIEDQNLQSAFSGTCRLEPASTTV